MANLGGKREWRTERSPEMFAVQKKVYKTYIIYINLINPLPCVYIYIIKYTWIDWLSLTTWHIDWHNPAPIETCTNNATFYCAMLLFPFTPKKLPSHPNPSNSPPKTWGSSLHHSIHTLPKTNSLHRKKKTWGWFFDHFPFGAKKTGVSAKGFSFHPSRFIFFSSAAFRKISKAWSETRHGWLGKVGRGWGRLGTKRVSWMFPWKKTFGEGMQSWEFFL